MKIIFLLLLFISACKSPGVEEVNPLETFLNPQLVSTSELREKYLQLVDDGRRDLGLDSFIYSNELEKVAQEHSFKMASGLVPFGHTGSTQRCSLIKTQLGAGNLCGEIIASGQDTPEGVYKTWTSSPSHESKIVSSRYTHTGLGIAKSEKGVIYWTHIFLEVE